MKRFGKKTPQHKFFLNPYADLRYTKCPKCDGKTKLRKLPLFIHIIPDQPVALNKTCRYCPSCDLLIAHKDELDELLAKMFAQYRPEIVGNDYLVIGTIERKDWKEGEMLRKIDEIKAIVHDFKKHLDFEPVRYQWVLAEK